MDLVVVFSFQDFEVSKARMCLKGPIQNYIK